MPVEYEHRCRGCKKVRVPPIEGPCPHCRRYLRTTKKRLRNSEECEEPELPEGPVSVGALLADRETPRMWEKRVTGLAGVDHVFFGGLPVVGSVLLCAREGIGKTSWVFDLLMTVRIRSLFLSTEQSKEDLIRQFSRFGAGRIARASKYMSIESLTDLDDILAVVEDYKPQILAVDSLHDIEGVTDDNDKPLASGREGAVTRAAKLLHRLARRLELFAILVGHMANDGTMMGGAHLRHAVDGVLGLYPMSEREDDPRRLLRFRGKSRFARLGHQALFRMTDDGFRDCGPWVEKRKDDNDPSPGGGRPLRRLRLVG